MEKDNKLGLGNEEAKVNNNSDNNNQSIKEEKEEEEHEEANPNLNLGSSSATENGDVLLLNVTSSSSSTRRTPFTDLSQVDSDHALARTLQEQERAYMMLTFNNEGSDYGSWDAGSYFHDDDDDDFGDPDDDDDDDDDADGDDDGDDDDETDGDALDVHAHDAVPVDAVAVVDLDPSMFSSDEAYARALQDAEEREMAARLFAFAGIHDQVADTENHAGNNSQDTWEEVDPDELSYEELLALGEFVGSESRGLSADSIASLPSVEYKAGSSQSGNNDSCVICRIDYEDGETLTLLSCKHSYHSECINNWLKINKVCPVCSAEVSTSGHS